MTGADDAEETVDLRELSTEELMLFEEDGDAAATAELDRRGVDPARRRTGPAVRAPLEFPASDHTFSLDDELWENVLAYHQPDAQHPRFETISETVESLLRTGLAEARYPKSEDYVPPAPELIVGRDRLPGDELAEHREALAATVGSPVAPRPVTSLSPADERRAVWQLSRRLAYEEEYDQTPYAYEGVGVPPDMRAYLWLAADRQVMSGVDAEGFVAAVGAACFRRYARWSLEWVWLNPYVRRQGLLTAAWPFFRARFGDFELQPPFSRAMRAFMESRGVRK